MRITNLTFIFTHGLTLNVLNILVKTLFNRTINLCFLYTANVLENAGDIEGNSPTISVSLLLKK